MYVYKNIVSWSNTLKYSNMIIIVEVKNILYKSIQFIYLNVLNSNFNKIIHSNMK